MLKKLFKMMSVLTALFIAGTFISCSSGSGGGSSGPSSNEVIVKLNPNSGKLNGKTTPTDVECMEGDNLDLSAYIPERNGYKFLGWSTSRNDASTKVDDAYIVPSKDITLYALWQEVPSVTITLYGPDGNDIKTGSKLEVGATFDISYSAKGYTYDGWATTEGGKVVYTGNTLTVTAAEANAVGATLSLYIKRTAIAYTINYYKLDGTTVAEMADEELPNGIEKTYTVEDEFELKKPTSSNENDEWQGWFEYTGTNIAAETALSTDIDVVSSIALGTTGNKVLYGKWGVRAGITVTLPADENDLGATAVVSGTTVTFTLTNAAEDATYTCNVEGKSVEFINNAFEIDCDDWVPGNYNAHIIETKDGVIRSAHAEIEISASGSGV